MKRKNEQKNLHLTKQQCTGRAKNDSFRIFNKAWLSSHTCISAVHTFQSIRIHCFHCLIKKNSFVHVSPHNINLNIHSTVFHLYSTVKADVSQSNSSTDSTSCLCFLNTCLDCTSQITEKKWSYSLTFSFSELRRGTGKAHTLTAIFQRIEERSLGR